MKNFLQGNLNKKLVKIMCFVMIAGVLPAFAGV